MQYQKNVSEFFGVLKCVTKRECVTSKVYKDARGYCIFKVAQLIIQKIFKALLEDQLYFMQRFSNLMLYVGKYLSLVLDLLRI